MITNLIKFNSNPQIMVFMKEADTLARYWTSQISFWIHIAASIMLTYVNYDTTNKMQNNLHRQTCHDKRFIWLNFICLQFEIIDILLFLIDFLQGTGACSHKPHVSGKHYWKQCCGAGFWNEFISGSGFQDMIQSGFEPSLIIEA